MNIIDILDDIYPIPESSKQAILEKVSEITYPKNYILFQPEKKGEKFYFIKEGLIRAFTKIEDKEITFWFGREGDISFPLLTLHSNQKGYEYVQLLEDTTFYEININDLHQLYATDLHLSNWGRKFAERESIRYESFFITRQFKSSLEKYTELITDYPDILQRVPLGIIASYLGINQVSLSRIRSQVSKKKI